MLRNLKQFNLAEIEEKVLKFWKERGIFEKSLTLRKSSFAPASASASVATSAKEAKAPAGKKASEGKKSKNKVFRFFEGPPYANGRPGIHHVLARVFKDIVLRFKTMNGYYVPRKAGWDTHGLPVEIDTEKQLGLKSKKDIEKFGIAAFNKKAKEGVLRYKDEFERLTERIGYWLDMKDAYVTYANPYIETLWWIFKEIDKRKLLMKGHKVVPWCTRCGTALASHELAQGYKEVTDQSVYVKFKLKPKQKIGNFITDDKTYILSWTTTPWTLPGNVALAVGKQLSYVIAIKNGEAFIVGANRAKAVLGDGYEIRATVDGKALVGLRYEPLFRVTKLQSPTSHRVYAADFVTTPDGTGVVHTAVMYGEDDYKLGKEVGLPQHHTVDESGHFTKDVKELAGLLAKDPKTDEVIFEHLKRKNLLLKTEAYSHEYPFCWRCSTPLLYYARDSWFIEISKLQDEFMKANSLVNWVPAHLKEGRFGEWLREGKDWNISRERYWGTPLPIWECSKCGHHTVAGSLQELDRRAPRTLNRLFAMRHGRAELNVRNILISNERKQDAEIIHLTQEGRFQVEAAARELKRQKIDVIYASPLTRTRESARIAAKILGVKTVIVDKRLREIEFGVMNGKLFAEYQAFFGTPLDHFTKAPEGGETEHDVKARVMEFVRDMNARYEGKRILIVSHASPIRIIMAALEGLSDEATAAIPDLPVATWEETFVHNWPYDEAGNLDLHRPYADAIALACEKCGKKATRVKEVADVWFDSGAMPFAEWHYPFENRTLIDEKESFPADYICEGLDQTRGWFYTLLAISVLLGRGAPYHNVLTLGLILDKHGQKMSKSKGNIVDPWATIQKFGIDTIRWYFFTAGDPAEPKKFDEAELAKTFRKFFLILYNSFSFLETYSGKHVALLKGEPEHALDRWILARLEETTGETTARLNTYDIAPAGRALEAFVDDLSRWYIRRSRTRLQESDEARATLAHALLEFAKLLAPFAPFFAEALYQAMSDMRPAFAPHSGASAGKQGKRDKRESVHLEDWPATSKEQIARSKELLAAMAEVRRIAAATLALRAEAKIKVRQPLSALKLKATSDKRHGTLDEELFELLKDEVNVKQIIFDPKIKNEIELDTKITPELYEEGVLRELARTVQELRRTAKLTVQDMIEVSLRAAPELLNVVKNHEKEFLKSVGAKTVIVLGMDEKPSRMFDAEVETKLNEAPLWVAIRKL